MFRLIKKIEIAGAHTLNLNYDSPCQKLHGHNWVISIYCKAEKLNSNGMIIDFKEIKNIVNRLDHGYINDHIEQPTAENIAEYLCNRIPFCYQVEVEESKNNKVIYEKDI